MNDETDVDDALPRRPVKSDAAFRTISEVSDDLDVPQHVLRFWESKFPQIKPLKRGGGRRYYRPEDVQLLRRIRDLLYKDGYTIRGVQKLLREQSRGGAPREAAEPEAGPAVPPPAEAEEEVDVEPEAEAPAEPPVDRSELEILLEELLDLRGFLANARKGGNPP